MSDPWLTIIGLGEDGAQGLSAAAREALEQAELVIGAPRHLALLPALRAQRLEWPVPFADGIALLLAHRGRAVAMLASGDPFWFGAGAVVARHLDPGEWRTLPVPSTFTMAAARLGWALQDTVCLGLHAAPLTRLRPHLAPGRPIIALMRDGEQVGELARYLTEQGFGGSHLHVMEALGGPRERIRCAAVETLNFTDIAHPVAVGIVPGAGPALPTISGLPDDLFASDGQITKRPIRALTLSALAPRAGETLWDIGAGSGSIGIEWLLAHRANRALAIEADPVRAARARANAAKLGVDHLQVIEGRTPDTWPEGPPPDAVFIGGGLSEALLEAIWKRLPRGTRLVANAVTLESECLLAQWHGRKGGALLRIELADAAPIGTRHGWRARYPVVQWSVSL
ncbi:precorrin-6y C5,15-methyltransferase (decarboxylating) subunit CbiE [Novosphingobium sp. KACC 22771]|uniref:precorrin-6y C5,15-methyltransferase (decarboxylating) subunit CbiE n=1 Tax=Novosphingobium sp. KACC 22771 TaxID=3025670 RepID=UPI0023650631|nr:precorrin-6y C5,15-methyltransferase (decarboxylating) subunit CbiE [Novosphingobium sp. KACC 22771]WDF74478.1 precorrin-6y C5,15-methyltransferase (decarboxylating) subunit CbiE [Novosphingobium sp. KACC 22771]